MTNTKNKLCSHRNQRGDAVIVQQRLRVIRLDASGLKHLPHGQEGLASEACCGPAEAEQSKVWAHVVDADVEEDTLPLNHCCALA